MDSDWRDTISTKNRYVIRCRRKKEKEREKELSSTFINTAYIHDRESDGTVEILIAISHGYRRQPIFPWWSVEDSWEEKRERNIRGASAIVILLLIVKTSDCLFSRERERENESLGEIVGTTSITSVLAFAVYLAWDRKALKVRWSAPSPLTLLRVALSQSFRWDER